MLSQFYCLCFKYDCLALFQCFPPCLLSLFFAFSFVEHCLIRGTLNYRYEKEGKPSQLAKVDIFVSTVDPMKEPPLITANTVLSILAVDYPVDKVSCYVSDDGAAMLTFEALSETSEFARKWVPFCKKYNIEPRAPEWYFSQKIDYLKNKVHPAFVRERRAMKVCHLLLCSVIFYISEDLSSTRMRAFPINLICHVLLYNYWPQIDLLVLIKKFLRLYNNHVVHMYYLSVTERI